MAVQLLNIDPTFPRLRRIQIGKNFSSVPALTKQSEASQDQWEFLELLEFCCICFRFLVERTVPVSYRPTLNNQPKGMWFTNHLSEHEQARRMAGEGEIAISANGTLEGNWGSLFSSRAF